MDDKDKEIRSITYEEWISGGRYQKIEDILRDHDHGD